MTNNTSCKSLDEVANNLILKTSKSSLLYAFNGSGKTRLSMAVKKILDDKQDEAEQEISIKNKKIFYYNAFTEDLFSWNNDLDQDEVRSLNINPDSKFVKYIIEEQGLDRDIINLFQDYLGIYREDNVKRNHQQIIEPTFNGYTNVSFSKTYTDKNEDGMPIRIKENDIKISKGEETNFIWSIFYTFINEVIESKNDDPDSFPELKYIFIDDPVSSLDDRRIIEVAVDLASLIKKSNFIKGASGSPNSTGLKFIITTHHPLFFNVLYNELKGDSLTRLVFEHRVSLNDGGETYYLKETNDSPFAYHLKVIDIIDEAIQQQQLEKYHYNLLRTVFEKTSTYLGYKDWKKLLPDDENKNIYNRYLNLFSHDKQSSDEFPVLTEDDKKYFNEVYKIFIKTYGFNKDINHLN
ncbi:anticodon nuclease [Streptococcus salivarius]|uniref:anticodon nuclease n=1 Tax=Streptococcus salivarius TaxID=1304 RepID=UPI00352CA763